MANRTNQNSSRNHQEPLLLLVVVEALIGIIGVITKNVEITIGDEMILTRYETLLKKLYKTIRGEEENNENQGD